MSRPERRQRRTMIPMRKGIEMLFIIAVVVLVLWLLGWLAFHIAGGFIHLLLIVALVVLVLGFLGGRKSA